MASTDSASQRPRWRERSRSHPFPNERAEPETFTMTFRDHTHDECRPQAPRGSHWQSRVPRRCSLVGCASDAGVQGVGSSPHHLCVALPLLAGLSPHSP